MLVEVEFHPDGGRRQLELPESARGLDLVRFLGRAPDTHLLFRGGTPITEDEALRDGDRLLLIAVVSGG